MKRDRVRLDQDVHWMRAVVDSMGEGLIAIDGDGSITAVNPYTLKALGYTEGELIGQWFTGTVVAVDQHRQPLENIKRPIVRALTAGEAVSDFAYYLRRDGSIMPVFLTVAPIIIDGRPQGAIELFRDITLDKQLDFAKDEFVSLASHQLRTPASGVKAILSMLMEEDFGALTAKQRQYIGRAMEGNDRQLQIIEDILNAARIDSGKMELAPERVDLVDLARLAVTEHLPEFEDRDQELNFEHSPQVITWADASKMRMVLDNLLSNASKYTPPGGTIGVHVGHDQDLAWVAVSDTGVGIADTELPYLFKKFSRINNDLSTTVGGTGLGLYLANNIVKLHQGTMSVVSQSAKGSTFRVALPIILG